MGVQGGWGGRAAGPAAKPPTRAKPVGPPLGGGRPAARFPRLAGGCGGPEIQPGGTRKSKKPEDCAAISEFLFFGCAHGTGTIRAQRMPGDTVRAGAAILGVQAAGQSGFLSGGGILVQDTLCSGLVDLLDRNADCLGLILLGIVGLLHVGLQLGLDGLITQSFGSDDLYSLLGGFDIGHVLHLLTYY